MTSSRDGDLRVPFLSTTHTTQGPSQRRGKAVNNIPDGERRREDGDFSHLHLRLGDELNLDLLNSMITEASPGGTVATHLGTPMVQTIIAADFFTYVVAGMPS